MLVVPVRRPRLPLAIAAFATSVVIVIVVDAVVFDAIFVCPALLASPVVVVVVDAAALPLPRSETALESMMVVSVSESNFGK